MKAATILLSLTSVMAALDAETSATPTDIIPPPNTRMPPPHSETIVPPPNTRVPPPHSETTRPAHTSSYSAKVTPSVVTAGVSGRAAAKLGALFLVAGGIV
ncbi:hypothetical protein VFPBJ_11597 [Purpureocillium lilacinum]|uniref:Uncharacterized protein n=1 Tax=Purpureocillium lilacinum TaxID=33203 RepID=A0A179F2W8_PURLI|nr:hypothetical protein VFPBJ_11597 [Purpureocillium lilacinum]